ncbi:hypothetical protein BT96DRAFT_1020641 [Gymnopus androsaceus JB14]|uniref:Uncharacterized protein n=1 Tax=Gymnopus androsaceus JB14 TaxID=1447944 RepID=A0A6A4HGJ0_9AGAR|nr:hypothetical protein BT96DRAFT_1020641 [Gymnopus androsaceus JB14]
MANVTIDDSDPSIIYLPAWNTRNASVPCATCTANPQADLMFDETWHDSTFNPSPGSSEFANIPSTASMLFNGTAMYVFCALAESSTGSDGDSDMSFYIDGDLKGTFLKIATGNVGVYDYNVPVFAIDSLTPEEHNFTLQGGHVNGFKSLVLLDRMVYTAFNSSLTSESSSSSISASSTSTSSESFKPTSSPPSSSPGSATKKSLSSIIGPAVAVPIVVLLLAAVALCLFLKWRKRRGDSRRTIPTINPIPPPMTSVWHPLSLPSSHHLALQRKVIPLPSLAALGVSPEPGNRRCDRTPLKLSASHLVPTSLPNRSAATGSQASARAPVPIENEAVDNDEPPPAYDEGVGRGAASLSV